VKKVMHLKGNGREKDGAMAETTTTSRGGATGMQGGVGTVRDEVTAERTLVLCRGNTTRHSKVKGGRRGTVK
jgi:hypothetical protein